MNQKSFFSAIVIAAVVAGATAFAQQQPHRLYNEIMKDVGATFASLKKNLDANSAAAAIEDAAKLQGLFKETEAFWAPLKTKDAVDFAKRASDAAAAVGVAAKSDTKAALESYTGLQKNCAGCHFSHREDTGKGFLIRP